MKINHLRPINDINIPTLPDLIRTEFEKIRFKFDNSAKVFYNKEAFREIIAEPIYVLPHIRLNTILQFNIDISEAIETYDEAFIEAFEQSDLLLGITDRESQIFEVFSGIYNQYSSIARPGLIYFKKNISRFNGKSFIHFHMSQYGEAAGRFILCWSIILNNPLLFEPIFNKYFSPTPQTLRSLPLTEKVFFKIGLLLAENKVYTKVLKTANISTTVYCYLDEEFSSVRQL
nr:hypothetical protein [Flavobacterium sp.]